MRVSTVQSVNDTTLYHVLHLLQTIYRDIKDTTVGTLSQRITNQVHGLKGLNSKLLDIRSYLERVTAGKLPINHQIIYQLQDVFNLLPDVNLLVCCLCLRHIYFVFIYSNHCREIGVLWIVVKLIPLDFNCDLYNIVSSLICLLYVILGAGFLQWI